MRPWHMLDFSVKVLATALVLLITACGSRSRHPDSRPAILHADVSVEVENHNWSDITVYLVTSGLPQRLGMVTAQGNANFAFPSQRLNTASNVRLRALPVAGEAYTTEPILVQPGQAIMWTLENDLDTSSWSVY
jgi:hypothetical protein